MTRISLSPKNVFIHFFHAPSNILYGNGCKTVPQILKKAERAAAIACRNAGQDTKNFACKIRSQARYLLKHGSLPPYRQGNHNTHASLLDYKTVRLQIQVYLTTQPIGSLTPCKLHNHLTQVILPALDPVLLKKPLLKTSISIRTATRWLHRLGYTRHAVKKGVYVDGHEQPDVCASRDEFLRNMEELQT